MNPKEKLAARLAELKSIIDTAAAEDRDLTEAEAADVEAKAAEVEELKAFIARAEKSQALFDRIAGVGPDYREDARTGEQIGGTGSSKGHLALTGPAVKSAAQRIAPKIAQGKGSKSFLAPGTTELFAVPLQADLVEQPRIPTSILELLPTTQRTVPVFDYLRQTGFDNNAAIVSPGQEKPESGVTLEKVRGELCVIAHITEPVDKYLLEDYDQLVSFVSGQMVYGLGRKLEAEVLNGDGTDQEGQAGKGIVGLLSGLISGVQTQAFAGDKLTTLRAAITQLEVLGYTAGAFILNPLDWAAIETARATSGSFDLGGPIDRAKRQVWGTQVVTSTGVPAGTAAALDLSAAAVDYDTAGIRTEWDKSQGFTRNEVLGRVEGRFGLSVFQPNGIIRIALAEPEVEPED